MSKPRFAKTGFRAALIAAALMSSTTFASAEETIKVGILHSLSGTMAISETTLKDVMLKVVWNGDEITSRAPEERARAGVAYVPQGRETFPLLTVRENLQTGLFVLPRAERSIPDEIFELFPVLKDMLSRRGGDLSGGQQQQLAIARALAMRPKLLILDEPTEGIQPSIIKDIERVIALLRERGGMAILLVEQYFDFAKALADTFAVMDRGEVIMAGVMADADEAEILKHMTI